MREGLGDHHAPLHSSRKRHDLGVFLVPQRQLPQYPFAMRRIGRQAEQPATESDRGPDAFERVRVKLLGHQPDLAAGGTEVLHDVVTIRDDATGRCCDDAADDADQRCLARTVRAQ